MAVPPRATLTLLFAALVVAGLLAMWAGWRAIRRRDAQLPALPQPPGDLGEVLWGPMPGRYVGSTLAGQWLSRVVARGLGAPSRGTLSVTTAGVVLTRVGAPDLFVPADALVAADLGRGLAGEVVEQGGMVVVTWRLGATDLDTAFRAREPMRHDDAVAAIHRVRPDLAAAARRDRAGGS